MGGVSGHVRVLHRNLCADPRFGGRHNHLFRRLCRCSYGEHIGSIHRKNVYNLIFEGKAEEIVPR